MLEIENVVHANEIAGAYARRYARRREVVELACILTGCGVGIVIAVLHLVKNVVTVGQLLGVSVGIGLFGTLGVVSVYRFLTRIKLRQAVGPLPSDAVTSVLRQAVGPLPPPKLPGHDQAPGASSQGPSPNGDASVRGPLPAMPAAPGIPVMPEEFMPLRNPPPKPSRTSVSASDEVDDEEEEPVTLRRLA